MCIYLYIYIYLYTHANLHLSRDLFVYPCMCMCIHIGLSVNSRRRNLGSQAEERHGNGRKNQGKHASIPPKPKGEEPQKGAKRAETTTWLTTNLDGKKHKPPPKKMPAKEKQRTVQGKTKQGLVHHFMQFTNLLTLSLFRNTARSTELGQIFGV